MTHTLIHPPKSMLEVWESLPEGTLCQIVNNKLIMSPAPQNLHQVILLDIAYSFKTFLNETSLGEIRIAPYDIYFSKENILQPDILYLKNENLHKIKDKGLFGSPDLIIEILSPSTSQLDYEDKKMIYEKSGVSEYFIVDPSSKSVDAFFLKNGSFEEQENLTGQINSAILETKINF